LSLIEVGCGKGHFLEVLQKDGFQILGMDPAYEGSNPAIVRQYFTPEAGLAGDGIILRHVLEHVRNPVEFLFKIKEANGGVGTIYIEVPCLDWICRRRAWFDIFYEHVNYFRQADFRRMFGVVHEEGRLFQGQYLYAVADLATLRIPVGSEADQVDFPADFAEGINRYALELHARGNAPVVVWGAASKGVTFSIFMERAGARVDAVVDINPAKQGRFLPITGLEVQTPETVLRSLPEHSEILVMNGNYLAEIKALAGARFCYRALDDDEPLPNHDS
jgi:hypothetical protein